MALVTTKELMLDAQKNHYAIGAFNAENMEMVQAIIAAAEELRAPVIVQTTPGTLKYASPAMFHAFFKYSLTVLIAIFVASSLGKWNSPVEIQQKAILSK